MEEDIYVKKDIQRKYYVDPDSLAREIFEYLTATRKGESRVVTLATDKKWWARRLITPYIGYMTNVSLGYNLEFSKVEVLSALREFGLSISQHSKCKDFYYIRYKEI